MGYKLKWGRGGGKGMEEHLFGVYLYFVWSVSIGTVSVSNNNYKDHKSEKNRRIPFNDKTGRIECMFLSNVPIMPNEDHR